jgi:hypothetical protein
MGQINFFRDLIDEKLSLGAQFKLNREYWNFREPNLIFFKSQLVQIRGKIATKSKFWDQLRAKLKKFAVNDHFKKAPNSGDKFEWNQGWN